MRLSVLRQHVAIPKRDSKSCGIRRGVIGQVVLHGTKDRGAFVVLDFLTLSMKTGRPCESWGATRIPVTASMSAVRTPNVADQK